jgi:hypothetical protein
MTVKIHYYSVISVVSVISVLYPDPLVAPEAAAAAATMLLPCTVGELITFSHDPILTDFTKTRLMDMVPTYLSRHVKLHKPKFWVYFSFEFLSLYGKVWLLDHGCKVLNRFSVVFSVMSEGGQSTLNLGLVCWRVSSSLTIFFSNRKMYKSLDDEAVFNA